MTHPDLILHLPMNEKSGSPLAYDYSKSRSDVVISNSIFVPGESGNSLSLDGETDLELNNSVINFSQPFTFLYSLAGNGVGTDTKPGVLVNFADDSTANLWANNVQRLNIFDRIAIVRTAGQIALYVNGALNDTLNVSSSPEINGIAAMDDSPFQFGIGLLDNVKVFQKALTLPEILAEYAAFTSVNYFLDNYNLEKDFYTFVSASSGVVDALKRKESLKVSWDAEHGEVIDLAKPVFEARDITLECWMRANDKLDFAMKVRNLIDYFSQPGTRRLKIEIDPTKPLVYEVFMPSGFEIEKRWNSSTMIGTFNLVLREPLPVKRVLRHIRSGESTKTATVNITCSRLLTIFWGDGAVTRNVTGTNVTSTHDYAANGEYDIVIAGNIEDITTFNTTSIVVWSKL